MNAKHFQQAIQALEQDPQTLRIRKFLFATATRKWPRNEEKLIAISITQLVSANLNQYPDASLFTKAVQQLQASLNKAQAYQPIAQKILTLLLPLYDQAEVTTTSPLPTISPLPLPSPPSQPEPQAAPLNPVMPATLWFDLRHDVTRYITPLQIKILVFATLYHQPDLNSAADWNEIYSFVLTDLLADLFVQYPNYDLLKKRVLGAAQGLESSDYLAAADRLLRMIQPIYTRYGSLSLAAPPPPPPPPTPSPSINPAIPHLETFVTSDESDEDATCVFFPPPP